MKHPAPGITPLGPDLRRVLAPNPSPMTYWGTNSYVLGRRSLAVIDPGPDDDAHLAMLLRAIGDAPVEAILVTHAHVDHSPLAPRLAAAVGAPVLAYGDARAGRSAVMTRLAAAGLAGGGEGVDHGFVPDQTLAHGAVVRGADWEIEALHTPGHMGNHLCFAWGDVLFSGDLAMGWASSLVSPPDGDLSDFMASCALLLERRWSVMHPGHGAPVANPGARLEWLVSHRRGREAQILEALTAPMGLEALTLGIYDDVAPALLPAAARNVFAHLVDLSGRGLVEALPELGEAAQFMRKK